MHIIHDDTCTHSKQKIQPVLFTPHDQQVTGAPLRVATMPCWPCCRPFPVKPIIFSECSFVHFCSVM